MAIRINQGSCNPAVEKTKEVPPLLKLPDQILCQILSYTHFSDGHALIKVNEALKGKVLCIVRYQYNNYLDALCSNIFSYFSSLLPEAYRQYVASKEVEVLEKINGAQTLEEIEEHAHNFWYKITEEYFSEANCVPRASKRFSMASTWSVGLKKKMCKDLADLGTILTRQVEGLQNQIDQIAIKGECDEGCRQIFLSISATYCLRPQEFNIEKWLQFVEKMGDGEWKEEKMRQVYERCLTYCDLDPFIATEEFFSRITLRAQLGYLEKLFDRRRPNRRWLLGSETWREVNFGERAVVFLDRVINHPNRETRKEMLFLFGWSFLVSINNSWEYIGIRSRICLQIERGISTLSEDDQKEGLFPILKWIISSEGLGVWLLTIQEEIEEYFKKQLKKGVPHSEWIVVVSKILSQLQKYGFPSYYRIELLKNFFMKAVFYFCVGREEFQTFLAKMSRDIGCDEDKARGFVSDFMYYLNTAKQPILHHLTKIFEIKENEREEGLKLPLLQRMEDLLVEESSLRKVIKKERESRIKKLAEAEEEKRKKEEERLRRIIGPESRENWWLPRGHIARLFRNAPIVPRKIMGNILSFIPGKGEY